MKLNLSILFCLLNLIVLQSIAMLNDVGCVSGQIPKTQEQALLRELNCTFAGTFGLIKTNKLSLEQIIQKSQAWLPKWSQARDDFEKYLNKYRLALADLLNTGVLNQVILNIARIDALEGAGKKEINDWHQKLQDTQANLQKINSQLDQKIKSLKGDNLKAASLLKAWINKSHIAINELQSIQA